MKRKICLIIDFFLINIVYLLFFALYILGIFKVDLSAYFYVFSVALCFNLVELSFSYYNYNYFLKSYYKAVNLDRKKGLSSVINESVFTFIISVFAVIKIVVFLFLALFYYYIIHGEFNVFLKIILPISFILLFTVELWMNIKTYLGYKKARENKEI